MQNPYISYHAVAMHSVDSPGSLGEGDSTPCVEVV